MSGKKSLTFRSDLEIVSSNIDGAHPLDRTFTQYFDTLRGKYLNLGLLPPVVKLITPLNEYDVFYVIVEQTPRRQTVRYHNHNYDIPLPWHSFIFTLSYNRNIDKCTSVPALFFQPREILSEFDLDINFFFPTFLPNTYHNGGICLGESFDYFSPSDFGEYVENFLSAMWATTWNDDIKEGWCAYQHVFGGPYEKITWKNLNVKFPFGVSPAFIEAGQFDNMLAAIEKKSLEEICQLQPEYYVDVKSSITLPFLQHLPSINPAISLTDIFKAAR